MGPICFNPLAASFDPRPRFFQPWWIVCTAGFTSTGGPFVTPCPLLCYSTSVRLAQMNRMKHHVNYQVLRGIGLPRHRSSTNCTTTCTLYIYMCIKSEFLDKVLRKCTQLGDKEVHELTTVTARIRCGHQIRGSRTPMVEMSELARRNLRTLSCSFTHVLNGDSCQSGLTI